MVPPVVLNPRLIIPESQKRDRFTDQVVEALRRAHIGGDAQIKALLDSAAAFADSYDDMNLTVDELTMVTAKTLLVQGDRDPFYPVEISVEMAKAIPRSSLWIVPNGGHVPVAGDKWQDFLDTAGVFLRE